MTCEIYKIRNIIILVYMNDFSVHVQYNKGVKSERELERKRRLKYPWMSKEKERERSEQITSIKERTNIHSHNVLPRVDPLLLGKGLAVLLELFVGALMIAALLDESRAGISSRLILVAVREWFVVTAM